MAEPGSTISARNRGRIAFSVATYAFVGVALAFAVRSYADGFAEPLADRHAFRQTQTAITAYYLAHGGPWFAYETPVLGAPYSIPFEFPLFQWIVAAIHRATSAPLDQVGRGVSIAFFLATLPAFFDLMRSFGCSRSASRIGIGILVTSPMYLYWTRTFLIESTALFFSVVALALGVRCLASRGGRRSHVALGVAATLAMLVKPTTAFAYLGALGLFFAHAFVVDPKRRARLRDYAGFALVAFVIPTIALVAWTTFADRVKLENPLARDFITSTALRDWNYGTREQKLAPATWRLLWERTLVETFGSPNSFLAIGVLAVLAVRPAIRWVALAIGVVATYAVFTNLHTAHDYYQYSTALLVVLVGALGIGHAERSFPKGRWVLLLVGAFIALESTEVYRRDYSLMQLRPSHALPSVGLFVRAHTEPSEFFVYYGEDWSPVIPYYAERRSIGNRWNHEAGHPALEASLRESRERGHRLGAVVSCHGETPRARIRSQALLGHAPECHPVATCIVCY